jgi:glycerol uptake facilitator-like aquaporin
LSIQKISAEFIGTTLLVAVVVGSGIMADRLTDDVALALLANTGATAAALYVLISIIAPISGAHFNPVVSIIMALKGQLARSGLLSYIIAQIMGAICGAWLAHLMFELPVLQISQTIRSGLGQFISEAVATFCLLSVILFGGKQKNLSMPALVSLTIASAYWFTASTSFANPAVTIARSLTNTFAGIAPENIVLFIVAQCVGAGLAFLLSMPSGHLLDPNTTT